MAVEFENKRKNREKIFMKNLYLLLLIICVLECNKGMHREKYIIIRGNVLWVWRKGVENLIMWEIRGQNKKKQTKYLCKKRLKRTNESECFILGWDSFICCIWHTVFY